MERNIDCTNTLLVKQSNWGLSQGKTYTHKPLYNTVHCNTVLDIKLFKDGSQKYIDYIEK